MKQFVSRVRGKIVAGANRLAHGEEGASIIEFAMGISVLLTLMFGMMATAFALYFYNSLNEAAREGTRYAVVRGNDWGAACASWGSYDCTASEDNVTSYIENLGFPGINANALGSSGVSATWGKSPTESSCVAANCEGMGDQVTVTVSYPFTLNIPFVKPQTISMASSSTMIVTY